MPVVQPNVHQDIFIRPAAQFMRLKEATGRKQARKTIRAACRSAQSSRVCQLRRATMASTNGRPNARDSPNAREPKYGADPTAKVGGSWCE